MITLTPATAVALVRKNLDEVEPNGSAMYDDEYGDNLSIDDIVRKSIPEAVNAIQSAAPAHLLDGDGYEVSETDAVSITGDGVLSFSLDECSRFLRLVAFRAADSDIVVTDAIPEASPEGRKQLNKYIRGRADRPRLIMRQGNHAGPEFKYYSITNPSLYLGNPVEAIAQFSYVREQFYPGSATGYPISSRLRQNIIDYLTAMVMEIYSDQRAQSYYQKAMSFPII